MAVTRHDYSNLTPELAHRAGSDIHDFLTNLGIDIQTEAGSHVISSEHFPDGDEGRAVHAFMQGLGFHVQAPVQMVQSHSLDGHTVTASEHAGRGLGEFLAGMGIRAQPTHVTEQHPMLQGGNRHDIMSFLTGLGTHEGARNEAYNAATTDATAARPKFNLAKVIQAFDDFVNALGMNMPPSVKAMEQTLTQFAPMVSPMIESFINQQRKA